MITVSIPAISADVDAVNVDENPIYCLVYDHLSNYGFAEIGNNVTATAITVDFESAVFDIDDEMDEANEHEKGLVEDGGEYAFIREDLQEMVSRRDPTMILEYAFTAHEPCEDEE